MAQVLKEEVRARIVEAGLAVLAEKGFAAATMAEIAEGAGISTGNVYRYFANKDVLFAEIVPTSFARSLSTLLRKRVEALRGVSDVRRPEAQAWRVVSEELLAFAIENRLRVIVLLGEGKATGTEHEGFAERTVHDLVQLAIAHARSLRSSFAPSRDQRFALERIYRGFVATITAILVTHHDEARIRAAVASFSTYHLAGMKAFIEEERS